MLRRRLRGSRDGPGDKRLTSREVEALTQVSRGNRIRDIGQRQFICEEIAKKHVKQITEKLGARDQANGPTIAARRSFIRV